MRRGPCGDAEHRGDTLVFLKGLIEIRERKRRGDDVVLDYDESLIPGEHLGRAADHGGGAAVIRFPLHHRHRGESDCILGDLDHAMAALGVLCSAGGVAEDRQVRLPGEAVCRQRLKRHAEVVRAIERKNGYRCGHEATPEYQTSKSVSL